MCKDLAMAQFTLTSTDTVPRSSSVTGTVTTHANSKTITGSGTSFLTEVMGGQWLYDSSNGQLRQVDYIVSDTELVLKSAFATPLSGATIKLVDGGSRQISVAAIGGDITMKDSLGNSSTIKENISLTPEADQRKAVNPIIVQATSAASAFCSTTP